MTTPTPVVLVHPKFSARDIFVRYLSGLLILAFRAWIVMLVLGIAHGIWPVIPPLGYGPVVALLVGLAYLKGDSKEFDPRWKDL